MTDFHVMLAWTAVAGSASLLAASVATAVGLTRSRLWLDRAILLQVGTALAASVGGSVLVAMGRGPSDPLHVLYGAVLVIGPLATRYLVRQAPSPRLGGVMTVVAVLGVGVLIRSFATGG
jgi:hypothetical protein